MCAFRCFGNLKSDENDKVRKAVKRVDSLRAEVMRRGSQLRRSFSRSPKFPLVKEGEEMRNQFFSDADTTVVWALSERLLKKTGAELWPVVRNEVSKKPVQHLDHGAFFLNRTGFIGGAFLFKIHCSERVCVNILSKLSKCISMPLWTVKGTPFSYHNCSLSLPLKVFAILFIYCLLIFVPTTIVQVIVNVIH